MKILVFLQGTVTVHENAKNREREEIIKQVIEGDESVKNYRSYIPIGNAVKKLQNWRKQGAEICYLSALTQSKNAREDERVSGKEDIKADEIVLKKHGFPDGKIYHRKSGEEYKDVVEKIKPLPDILIEDDCESIGKEEMTYPSLRPELKAKIKSIVVKELIGIDHLPDKVSGLLNFV